MELRAHAGSSRDDDDVCNDPLKEARLDDLSLGSLRCADQVENLNFKGSSRVIQR